MQPHNRVQHARDSNIQKTGLSHSNQEQQHIIITTPLT
ncbi:hypothetical protein LINPERHAP1_LOCUS7171, partial [Linum perenne]